MKKLVAALLLSSLSSLAAAQMTTPSPSQAPASDAAPMTKKKVKPTTDPSPSTATIPDSTATPPATTSDRRAARRAKRAAKVGDKPLN